MKKLLSFLLTCLFAVVLLSWGTLGHQSIALIAQQHLTPRAKAAVQYYLGSQSLSDVSNWADEVRNSPEFKHTAPWHFLNLPLGLSYEQFQQQVKSMSEDNVYKALLQNEQIISDAAASKEDKAQALKFIVHFVGDMHQPMHISRREDKGGNTIQVNYEGKGTNLHALWDSRLLEHQGLSVEQLANQIDKATPEQIKQWQSDSPLQWVWESYGLSTQLYAEVAGMNNRTITDQYYQEHITIVDQRIEQAGIRLAGLLNTLFASASFPQQSTPAPVTATQPSNIKEINISEVGNHIGESVSVCAPMYGYKELQGMTLVNLGATYPDQLLTVVLKGEAKQAYKGWQGQNVCVKGQLVLYKGKPEIVVTDTSMISSR